MTRRYPTICFATILCLVLAGCDSASPTQPTAPPIIPPVVATPPNPTPPANPNAVLVNGYVADTAWRPLSGVRIEVLDGPQAGSFAMSDAGSFRLVGEFNETTRFRASLPGHHDRTALPFRCALCNPSWVLSFSLEPDVPPINLTGNYDLTFVTLETCTVMPAEYRRRTYPVTLTRSETNSRIVISFRAGSFLPRYDSFDAGLAGDYFAAILGDLHGSPGVVERVGENAFLGFEGQAEARIESDDGSSISATFDGVISYCELNGEPASRYTCPLGSPTRVLCASNRHQLLLQR
jgi:hypothetical protein